MKVAIVDHYYIDEYGNVFNGKTNYKLKWLNGGGRGLKRLFIYNKSYIYKNLMIKYFGVHKSGNMPIYLDGNKNNNHYKNIAFVHTGIGRFINKRRRGEKSNITKRPKGWLLRMTMNGKFLFYEYVKNKSHAQLIADLKVKHYIKNILKLNVDFRFK